MNEYIDDMVCIMVSIIIIGGFMGNLLGHHWITGIFIGGFIDFFLLIIINIIEKK